MSPAAERQLGQLRGANQIAIRGVILNLATDPRPAGAIKLVGLPNVHRLRVRVDGRPWRVIYRVDDVKRVVVVARVARRDDATYRGL
jgi:mRNA interferase RelE/StbE